MMLGGGEERVPSCDSKRCWETLGLGDITGIQKPFRCDQTTGTLNLGAAFKQPLIPSAVGKHKNSSKTIWTMRLCCRARREAGRFVPDPDSDQLIA